MGKGQKCGGLAPVAHVAGGGGGAVLMILLGCPVVRQLGKCGLAPSGRPNYREAPTVEMVFSLSPPSHTQSEITIRGVSTWEAEGCC